MPDTTLLAFAEIDLPPYAARGISQRLKPIGEVAQLARTVNGALVDLAVDTAFRKFESTITCTDMDHPAPDDLWPGMTLTVDCLTELKYPATTDGAPARTPVSGSERTEGGMVYYRPVLTMKLVDYDVQTDEYGAAVSWTMELAEV